MTTNPLDEIQARADAATEGPWEAYLGAGWYVQDSGCDEIAVIMDRPGIDEDPQAEANANFIINARSDIPALVAALRAVEAVHVAEDCCGDADCRGLVGCLNCHEYWPCETVQAIREALG